MDPIANPYVARAVDEIDAALFSGDVFFDPAESKALLAYLKRWSKRLREIKEMLED